MSARANNFDALRLLAALSVVWSHAFAIAQGPRNDEWLVHFSREQTDIGRVAVALFFVVSGYLITKSFERRTSLLSFVQARVLRIMPALLVVLLLTAFVIGPLVSSLPLGAYFRDHGPYLYVALQSTFAKYYDVLPGVFEHAPFHNVNASLWTLRLEVECYALVFVLGVVGLLNRWVLLGLFVAGSAYLTGVDVEAHHRVDLGTKFLAGALILQFAPPYRKELAWASAAALLLSLRFGGYGLVERVALPYLTMYLAVGVTAWRWNATRFGDLSYGVYIYGWLVLQLFYWAGVGNDWPLLTLLSIPTCLGLAWLSWHLVEHKALSLKSRRVVAAPPIVLSALPVTDAVHVAESAHISQH